MSRLFLDIGLGKAPTTVRLFPRGKFGTTKGELAYTDRSEALIKAQWAKLNRSFGFDFGHSEFSGTVQPEDKIAAGWGRLDFRGDGLYVIEIEWTARAAAKIVAREFRNLSPALSAVSGEITAVYNAAVCNLPATHGAEPLVLSAQPHLPRRRHLMSGAKHAMLAQQMHHHLHGLMGVAKTAAESDHEGLKALGAKCLEMLPEHYSALGALMSAEGIEPAGEPDGDEELTALAALVKVERAKLQPEVKDLLALRQVVQKVTGKQKGLIGAVTALAQNASRAPKVDPAVEKAVQRGIATRKIHPSDAEAFRALSLDDIETHIELASTIEGPTSLRDGGGRDGSAEITGKPTAEEKAADEAATATAARLFSART